MPAMNPQLVKLFRDALDIAPPERRAYLGLHCSDPKLRAQLDSLLLAAEQTERPLPEIELPVLAVGQRAGGRNVELADRSGEQMGAFRFELTPKSCATFAAHGFKRSSTASTTRPHSTTPD